MKNLITKLVLGLWITILASLPQMPVTNAAYINLGTLDVKVKNLDNSLSDWIVASGAPGEKILKYIQISNFSANQKAVQLYKTDTSKSIDENFIVNSAEESSEKLSPWIKLTSQTVTLAAGESKIVPALFTLPKNAGVGLHTGAIMVRELDEKQTILIEKGVRIYLSIVGPMVNATDLSQIRKTENITESGAELTIQNNGTTDYENTFTLSLKNIFGEQIENKTIAAYIRPGETEKINLAVNKPIFGLYQISLESEQSINNYNSTTIGYKLIAPAWSWLILGIIIFIYGKSQIQKTKSRRKKTIPFNSFTVIKNSLKTPQLKRSFAYFGIFLFTIALIGPLGNKIPYKNLSSNVLGKGKIANYTTTIKWGNFKGITVPKNYQKKWEGQITIKNATATINELLNLESGDAITLSQNNTVLNFNLKTDQTNDGLIMTITPDGDLPVEATYEDAKSNKIQSFKLDNHLNSSFIIPSELHAVQIKIIPNSIVINNVVEMSATDEINATNEILPVSEINIPELKNLFNEIPASSDVLTEYILSSDYVKKITTENSHTNVDTDPALINALASTPEIIREIASTPNLNFTFVPSEIVDLPPTQFSFDNDASTTRHLGTLIFVQNKSTPWNTYISTTNLISLSKKKIIPAGSLSIIPGEITILSGDKNTSIDAGDAYNLKGTFDKTVLVNVNPTSSQKTVFSMNPQLSVRIPHGTTPGRYRGSIIITNL